MLEISIRDLVRVLNDDTENEKKPTAKESFCSGLPYRGFIPLRVKR